MPKGIQHFNKILIFQTTKKKPTLISKCKGVPLKFIYIILSYNLVMWYSKKIML